MEATSEAHVVPATPERWPEVEELFGPRGAVGGCWCMYWRLPRKEYEVGKGDANRQALHTLVAGGGGQHRSPPGLLAYLEGRVVGWVAVAPRADYPRLENSRNLARVDDTPVWSLSCLFVDKAHRRRGVSMALIRGAIDFVSARGGSVLEAYPVDPENGNAHDASVWTGVAAAFASAGFVEVERRAPTRPIMRYAIDGEASRGR